MTAHEDASPWSRLGGVAAVDVRPYHGRLDAALAVPGSKSVSNRALILAAVADGPCRLDGVLRSDDTYWVTDALRRLGATVEVEGDRFAIDGGGLLAGTAPTEVFLGAAGTAARFLPGVLAARRGPTTLRGGAQLSGRPITPLVEALRTLGARIEGDRLPLSVAGGSLPGGAVSLSGRVSSQFISGVLMAAPLAQAPVTVTVVDEIVQKDYVGITLTYMDRFGVGVDADPGFQRFAVTPQRYRAASLALEADASTTTYFTALAAVTGGRVAVTNLGTETTQPDYGFTDILERMGARVERTAHSTTVIGPERLKGGFDIDMKPLSDATLTLAALAPFADGPIHIHGVAHIRHHESDRIGVICRLLSQLGVAVEERPDGLSVHPGRPRFGAIDPHNDHRVAMAMSLVGLAGDGVRITHPNCVSKTCPDYFELLAGLGVVVTQA